MRRGLIAGAAVLVLGLSVGLAIITNEPTTPPSTSPASTALEATLHRTAAVLPKGWSVARDPTSMDERSVPPWFRCWLPASSVFGDVIANERFRGHRGEVVSETIGFATTHDATRAIGLLRAADAHVARCLRSGPPAPPRPRRTDDGADDATVSPYETGVVGWTGYAPARLLTSKLAPAGPGADLERSGVTIGRHETSVFSAILRKGYALEASFNGPMTARQVGVVMHRLAGAL